MHLRLRGVRAVVPVLAALVAVAGCAASTGHPSGAPAAGQRSLTSAIDRTDAVTGVAGGTTAGKVAQTVSGGSPSVVRGSGKTARQAPAGGPAAGSSADPSSTFVWSVTAQVEPTCVPAGSTATVRVQTTENAALAYVAVYHGEKSGAAPPFGYGYGGNADGYSSMQDGHWSDTWTIRADAPRGTARVTVVVASHQTSKQVDVPFTVVDPVTGKC